MPDINELIENAKRELTELCYQPQLMTEAEYSDILFRQIKLRHKLEAYLEVKEWLDAWMKTGEGKNTNEHIAEILRPICNTLIPRAGAIRHPSLETCLKDLQNFADTYNPRKQTGEVEVTYTPYAPKCIRCDSSEGVRLGAEKGWYHCDRCEKEFISND